MKYYTESEILAKYERLSHRSKVEVLDSALDYMQQYNGRTKFSCIAFAMGYVNKWGLCGTYYKLTE